MSSCTVRNLCGILRSFSRQHGCQPNPVFFYSGTVFQIKKGLYCINNYGVILYFKTITPFYRSFIFYITVHCCKMLVLQYFNVKFSITVYYSVISFPFFVGRPTSSIVPKNIKIGISSYKLVSISILMQKNILFKY